VSGFFELCVSDRISDEVERVLAVKFRWSKKRLHRGTQQLWSSARWISPQRTVTDCRDPDDNHVLECALEAQARCIITGDHHLLAVHPYQGIDILTPRQFLDSKSWETAP
jgi:uncharacterized protein